MPTSIINDDDPLTQNVNLDTGSKSWDEVTVERCAGDERALENFVFLCVFSCDDYYEEKIF